MLADGKTKQRSERIRKLFEIFSCASTREAARKKNESKMTGGPPFLAARQLGISKKRRNYFLKKADREGPMNCFFEVQLNSYGTKKMKRYSAYILEIIQRVIVENEARYEA